MPKSSFNLTTEDKPWNQRQIDVLEDGGCKQGGDLSGAHSAFTDQILLCCHNPVMLSFIYTITTSISKANSPAYARSIGFANALLAMLHSTSVVQHG